MNAIAPQENRTERILATLRVLKYNGELEPGRRSGYQVRLAKMFGISRQRVHQLVRRVRAER